MMWMTPAPYLKPWWRITCEAARVTFGYGDDAIVCEGKSAATLLPRLIPLLDGRHTLEAFVAELGPRTEPFVRKTLELFASRGLLADGGPLGADVPSAMREAVHFLAATQPRGGDMRADAGRLGGLRVATIGDSHVASETARALSTSGATVQRSSWDAPASQLAACDLVLIAPAPDELPRLGAWNARALETQTTWLGVLPFDGRFAAVGPLYIPGETACYECFRYRRAANVSYAAQWWAMQDTPAGYPSPLPIEMMLAGLASLAVLRWHLRRDPGLPGAFSALEFNGEIGLGTHVVYRVPRCPACATVGRAAPVLPWFEAPAWSA